MKTLSDRSNKTTWVTNSIPFYDRWITDRLLTNENLNIRVILDTFKSNDILDLLYYKLIEDINVKKN